MTIKRLPILAAVLGVAGLVPFLACTIGIILFPSQVPLPNLMQALSAYGAVTLSFLGGVHWGLALEPAPALLVPGQASLDRRRLALGVLPALVGWAALLVPMVASPLIGVVLLILGFIGTVLVEQRGLRAGVVPGAYMTLRWLLSAVVLICLVFVLLVRIF